MDVWDSEYFEWFVTNTELLYVITEIILERKPFEIDSYSC